MITTFEEKLPTLSELKCGYLEKRTNAKRWIEDDKDLEAMYKTFSDKAEITLWCEGPSSEEPTSKRGKKRKSDDSGDSGSSKRSAREETIDNIVQTLRKKHGEDYSAPQYRMWARMKHNGQHSSLDEPPPYPLFSGGSKKPPAKHESALTEALTNCANVVVGAITGNHTVSAPGSVSPGKRARVSGLYLEQLERLRALQQSGVLTSEEFEEQKAYALKNIRELNK